MRPRGNENHGDAYIIDGVRTPIGSFGGSLSEVRPDDMAALVIQRLLARAAGCRSIADHRCDLRVRQPGRARTTATSRGWRLAVGPANVGARRDGQPSVCLGIERGCTRGPRRLARGGRLYIAGGVESMTRAPYVLSKSGKAFARDAQLFDTSIGWRFVNPRMQEQLRHGRMGETAENVAAAFTCRERPRTGSRARHRVARPRRAAAGDFAVEIMPVDVPGDKRGEVRRFEQDEFIRPDTTLEALGKLKPAFRAGGSVTAGNSSGHQRRCGRAASGIGACRASEFYLEPIARVVAATVAAGVEPRIMGMGPVPGHASGPRARGAFRWTRST